MDIDFDEQYRITRRRRAVSASGVVSARAVAVAKLT